MLSGDHLQRIPAPADVPRQTDIPDYWTSRLDDIERELSGVRNGVVKQIAESAGGLPVYSVTYGEKDYHGSRANFNSACGAGNPAFYALKTEEMKPVVQIIGPVHGHEVENIVGAVNLIHVLETGVDHQGREWPELRKMARLCRLVIIPCGNPDGRRRCPYDSFVGLPDLVMTKYGQGTRKDGTMWYWPHCKANHPMTGDVEILGCYYNDNGINPAHDDFFGKMAAETAAILDVARNEAPDIAVSLHSCENPPFLIQTGFVPQQIGLRIRTLATRLRKRLKSENLPAGSIHELPKDDGKSLSSQFFNICSAIYHVCGATAFFFECIHGTVLSGESEPAATYQQILDIQLSLFKELLSYAISSRLYWRNMPEGGYDDTAAVT